MYFPPDPDVLGQYLLHPERILRRRIRTILRAMNSSHLPKVEKGNQFLGRRLPQEEHYGVNLCLIIPRIVTIAAQAIVTILYIIRLLRRFGKMAIINIF